MAALQLSPEFEWNSMELKSLKVTFIWTIKNYIYQIKYVGHKLKSPIFSSDCSKNIAWYLIAAPSGLNETSKDHLSLYLHPVFCCDINTVSATVRLSVVSTSNEKTISITQAIPYQFYRSSPGFGSDTFASTKNLLDREKDFLPNNALTITCELHIIDTVIKDSTMLQVKPTIGSRLTKNRLVDDMTRLFESQMLSDIILTANGKNFKAHKCILAARSPVFAAMFSHNMKENNLNVVEISDIDDSVLREILRFAYIGKVCDLETMATDLFIAADKYAIPDLVDLCEESLCYNLTIQTAAELLILADLHKLKRLKSETMKFINTHISSIVKTEAWNCLVLNHSLLLNEVLIYHVDN